MTIPEATPALAPQKGAIQKLGILVDKISKRVVKSELDADATGTWGSDEATFDILELCIGSKELLAASVLPLPSERIVVVLAGAHACPS